MEKKNLLVTFHILSIEMEKKFCEIPYKTYNNLLESYNEINSLITNDIKINH